jgi:hypothetical protein
MITVVYFYIYFKNREQKMNAFSRKLLWLAIFTIAMAYVESTVVVYLRQIYYPDNLQVIFPLKMFSHFSLVVELFREAATIIIMLSVAFLFERKNRTRIFAAFIFQFGVWDIFYYIWLKATIGWPVSWTEWDILFLIPWAWLGPWICPVLISVLFVLWSSIVLMSDKEYILSKLNLQLFISGSVLGLTSFLQPAMPYIVENRVEDFQYYLPGNFWWWMFIPGLLLMTVGLMKTLWKKDSKLSAN